MKKPALFLLAVTLALLTLFTGRGRAAPAQQTNLLQNPGLEQPYSDGVAQYWQRWNIVTQKQDEECLVAYHYQPKWSIETASGMFRDGGASQHVSNNWDTWAGGVFQTVPATPGTLYRFSFAGRGRGTSEPLPAPSEANLQMNVRAGIDPNGSGAWNDTDVVWGPAGSPHDSWQTFTVEAVATGNQISVFTSANWAVTGVNQCRQFLDTWFDAAQLVAQVPPTATPRPATAVPPTAVPATATQIPAPTGGVPTEAADTPTPAPTATPAGRSTICMNAFSDINGDGLHGADEEFIAGVTLTVAQGNRLIGQAVSTGTETPVCIDALMAGTYQVAQTLPATLELTTQANATVDVGEGRTVGLEFGSRPRAVAEVTPTAVAQPPSPTPAIEPTPSQSTGGAPSWLVAAGLGAVILGVVLLGVLLYLVLRR